MKKFIVKVLFYFIPFCCLYSVNKILNDSFTGDIGKLGQIPFGEKYVKYLEQNYLSDNLTIDTFVISSEKLSVTNASKVFTIGDSFSQQEIFGYQNYMAHFFANKIVNIKNNETNIATTIALLNSGIIDSTTCQIVILEQVDRAVIEKLAEIDFDVLYEPLSLDNNQTKTDKSKDWELFHLCSFIRLQCGYNNPIKKCNLKQEYFTDNSFSKKLYYYTDDLDFIKRTEGQIKKAEKNLLLLNKKFSEKGIKLIFLIAADKYDVYRPFAVNNHLPIDTTSDELSNLPDICVINTKSMLQDMVRSGEKDVYMVNDTHWSYKGSMAVARKLVHCIDSLKILK